MPEQILEFLQELVSALEGVLNNSVDEKNLAVFQAVVQWSAILLSALAGTYAARPVERMVGEESMLFILVDAVALGLWAYLGTIYALIADVPAVITPVLGVVTAIFGGVLRDVFFARIPQQFQPGQFYALAAALGAVVYVLFWSQGLGGAAGFIACIVVTFLTRMASVKFNLSSF